MINRQYTKVYPVVEIRPGEAEVGKFRYSVLRKCRVRLLVSSPRVGI